MPTPTIEELTARVEELETQVAYLQERADVASAVSSLNTSIEGQTAAVNSTNIVGASKGPFDTNVENEREFVVSPWPPVSEEDEETEENP